MIHCRSSYGHPDGQETNGEKGERQMPGTYRCPKGGKHEWVKGVTKEGVKYKKCKKCGQKKPI